MRRIWMMLLLAMRRRPTKKADGYPGSLAVRVVDPTRCAAPRGRVSLTLWARGNSVGYWHLLVSTGKAVFPGPHRGSRRSTRWTSTS
jgi:hypothetical protein